MSLFQQNKRKKFTWQRQTVFIWLTRTCKLQTLHYIIYIQLTEYHESCWHTTATNNSRPASNSYIWHFWADRWKGRHEPVTTQYTRHTEVFNINHRVRELSQSEVGNCLYDEWVTHLIVTCPPYWRELCHSSVTVTLTAVSCRHLANNIWLTKVVNMLIVAKDLGSKAHEAHMCDGI